MKSIQLISVLLVSLLSPCLAVANGAKSNARLTPEMHERRALVTWSKPHQARNLSRAGSKQYYLASTSERARQKRQELLSKGRSKRRMAELERLVLSPKTKTKRLRKALLPLIKGKRPAQAKTIVEAVLLHCRLAYLDKNQPPDPRKKYKALKTTSRSKRLKEKLHKLKMDRHQRQSLEASESFEKRASQLFVILKEEIAR